MKKPAAYNGQGDKLVTMAGVGAGLAAAGVWCVVSKAAGTFISPTLGNSDPLVGRNSPKSMYDRAVQRVAIQHRASISLEYEEIVSGGVFRIGMDRVSEVIDNYKALMTGSIKDETLTHIPTEYLYGDFNPDYLRYLNTQKNLGCGGEWIDGEINRIENLEKIKDVLDAARKELRSRGVKEIFIRSAVTLERCALFSMEDWKKLISALEDFEREGFNPDVVRIYLNFETYAYDIGHMAVFNTLCQYGNHLPTFIEILEAMKEGFTAEDVKDVIEKVVGNEMGWKEAFYAVLKEKRDREKLSHAQSELKNKIWDF